MSTRKKTPKKTIRIGDHRQVLKDDALVQLTKISESHKRTPSDMVRFLIAKEHDNLFKN
jgi:hypothetical protein